MAFTEDSRKQVLSEILKAIRLRRRPSYTLKNNIKTHMKQMKRQGVDWLHLVQMCIRHINVNVKCPYPWHDGI